MTLSVHVHALWLGRITYANGLSLQQKFLEKLLMQRKSKTCTLEQKGFLLLLEHEPVYTVGLRGHQYSKVQEEQLKKLGADFSRTDRGGLVTFHGPGQLLAYPILDLSLLSVHSDDQQSLRVGARRFVYLIEDVLIRTVRSLGLSEAGRSPNTGVWLDGGLRKIASIGVNFRHGISSHGLALNCNNQLHWFDYIVPCGLEGKLVTSISKELGRNVAVDEVKKLLCDQFSKVFQCHVTHCTPDWTS